MVHCALVEPQRGAAFFDVDKTLLPGVSTEALLVKELLRGRLPGRFHLGAFFAETLRLLPQGLTVARKANKAYVAGATPEQVARWGETIFRSHVAPRLGTRGKRWIEREREHGRAIVLLTGMPELMLRPFALHFASDFAVGTELEVAPDGRLTGRLAGPHPYGEVKREIAERLAGQNGWPATACSAYGDHGTDEILLAWVGEAYAVDPDPALRRSAQRHGWTILEGDAAS
jgi:putative phosphoserine phosphatase/1-acylglycerol-3-phosphate O-acyltransferase